MTLPPGQIETRRFPLVGERAPSPELAADPGSWTVSIEGIVEEPMVVGLSDFVRDADHRLVFDLHCVTSWTRFGTEWMGMPLRDLVTPARPKRDAAYVSFESYSVRNHHTSLPIDVALSDSWLVHSVDSGPLSLEHGGPVRVVTPGRYFYKSLKWVKAVVFLEVDRPGWWEVNSSYHNNADPTTGQERFNTGSLRPEQLRRFLTAASYEKYRTRPLLGLDLRQWTPATADLRQLHLKACDLRGVSLAGADLRGCNLSLSDLRGADLTNARLDGSDLEGANFIGARLVGADFSNSLLSATRFGDGKDDADVTGARFVDVWGLVEDQESFLAASSVELRTFDR